MLNHQSTAQAISTGGSFLTFRLCERAQHEDRVIPWHDKTDTTPSVSDSNNRPAAPPPNNTERTRSHLKEIAVRPWQYLVRREHVWRKQLYLAGRNLTARQLVGSIEANQLDEKQASENYHLAIEAIREALAYVEQNRELIETETEIERLMLKRTGVARGPQTVS